MLCAVGHDGVSDFGLVYYAFTTLLVVFVVTYDMIFHKSFSHPYK
jgi:hypothetical protein